MLWIIGILVVLYMYHGGYLFDITQGTPPVFFPSNKGIIDGSTIYIPNGFYTPNKAEWDSKIYVPQSNPYISCVTSGVIAQYEGCSVLRDIGWGNARGLNLPIISKEDIVINFEKEYSFFRGEIRSFKIYATNNFGSPLNNKDLMVFVVQSSPDGTFVWDRSIKGINIPAGESIYNINLPTGNLGEYYIFSYVLMGVHDVCTSDCQYIFNHNKVLQKSGEYKRIYFVNPKPIYIAEGDCRTNEVIKDGYSCEEATGLYIRTDIVNNELSCLQFEGACPVTPDMTYECSSAGYCVEKVTQYRDCSSNLECGVGEVCYSPSGTCMLEDLYNVLTQCKTSAECPSPCQGMTASCNVWNLCDYSGTCDIDILQCFQDSDCPATPCSGVVSSCKDNMCYYEGSCDPDYYLADCTDPDVVCSNGYECGIVQINGTDYNACVMDVPAGGSEDCFEYDNELEMYLHPCSENYKCIKQEDGTGSCINKILLNCKTTGCPDGKTCIASDTGLYYCKDNVDVRKDCRSEGCPEGRACKENQFGNFNCEKGDSVVVDKTALYLLVIGIIALLFIPKLRGKR